MATTAEIVKGDVGLSEESPGFVSLLIKSVFEVGLGHIHSITR